MMPNKIVMEVRGLEIKEMSLEEKYDKLYDQYVLTDVIAAAFIMEKGLTDEYIDYGAKAMKKMMPSLMGSVFKLIKILSPEKLKEASPQIILLFSKILWCG